MSKDKGDNKKKWAVRIICGVLAFSMISATLFYILYYIIEYFKELTV